ncbi:hypothetical protein ON010_g15791 [Phytophthora cinnamomi]|nr:hypothetical protein ON010_g15791 [Phytophthora cinnamomi]
MPRSKRTASYRYWGTDGDEGTGTPSSIDVLFQWLNGPGNYYRWRTEKKQTVCEDIVAFMKNQGISHRGNKQVMMKMFKLESSFETGTNWLVANGHYTDFRLGKTSVDIRKKLGKLCQYYDELAPVFLRGDPAEAELSQSSNETVPDAGQHDALTGAAVEITKNSRMTDSAEELYSQSPHLSVMQCSGSLSETPSQLGARDGTKADAKLAFEDYSRSLHEMEMQSKKTQLRADEICHVALNRKRMLDAGIALGEVNRLLPQ